MTLMLSGQRVPWQEMREARACAAVWPPVWRGAPKAAKKLVQVPETVGPPRGSRKAETQVKKLLRKCFSKMCSAGAFCQHAGNF